MDFNELKQDAEKLCKELNDKAPADLSVLVLSLTTIINMMLTMFSNSMEQNNKLLATISDLQETINDLQRQLNMDSHISSKPKKYEQNQISLKDSHITSLEREYDKIMDYANIECPPPDNTEPIKRGKRKKGKERSLTERLIKLKASVCLFIHNFAVPFDNNQTERDVRNVKTKSKVSGCFRSIKGAQTYLTITSFLSTARKQGIDAFEVLTSAFNGKAEIVLG